MTRVAEASDLASPLAALDVVRRALRALCADHVPEQREIGRRIDALLATSADLRERAAYKRSTIAETLAETLAERGTDAPLAGALADLGVRAYYDGFADWTRGGASPDPTRLVEARLDALLAAVGAAVGSDRARPLAST